MWTSCFFSTDTHGELIDEDYRKYILQWIKDHKPKRLFHLGDLFLILIKI